MGDHGQTHHCEFHDIVRFVVAVEHLCNNLLMFQESVEPWQGTGLQARFTTHGQDLGRLPFSIEMPAVACKEWTLLTRGGVLRLPTAMPTWPVSQKLERLCFLHTRSHCRKKGHKGLFSNFDAKPNSFSLTCRAYRHMHSTECSWVPAHWSRRKDGSGHMILHLAINATCLAGY